MKKLKKGMVFDNMNELFRYLDQPIVKGNSRKKNIKYIQSLCEYRKIDGNKIFIEKVYNKQRETKEQRGKHSSKYNQKMAILLYHILRLPQTDRITQTKIQLIQKCFPDSLHGIPHLYQSEEISKEDTWGKEIIYGITMRKLEDMIKAGLNLLKKEKYISFEKVYMVRYKDEHTGEVVVEECTPRQQEMIQMVKEEILVLEGYASEQVLQLKPFNTIRKFYEKLNDCLDRRYQFRCYRAYQIDPLQNLKPYLEFDPAIQIELLSLLKEMILDAIEKEKEKLERKINEYADQLDSDETSSIAAQMILAEKTLTRWMNEDFTKWIELYIK